jgi:hypothetical protein
MLPLQQQHLLTTLSQKISVNILYMKGIFKHGRDFTFSTNLFFSAVFDYIID